MQDLDPSDICKKDFLNPLKRIRVIIRTPTHGRTDGRTDRQTDGRTGWIQYTPPKLRFGGYNNIPALVQIMACCQPGAKPSHYLNNANPVHQCIYVALGGDGLSPHRPFLRQFPNQFVYSYHGYSPQSDLQWTIDLHQCLACMILAVIIIYSTNSWASVAINSLASQKFEWNFRYVILKQI